MKVLLFKLGAAMLVDHPSAHVVDAYVS